METRMTGAMHFDTLQKIYIAFYQRPADPAGMTYWAGQLAEAQDGIALVIDAFAASVEAQALYGQITQDSLNSVIDKVYQALFLREPDSQGKAFYQAAFAQGALTAGNIVLAILQGAQDDDLAAIKNKLAVAKEFTRQVDGRDCHHGEFGNGWDAAYAYAGKDHVLMARSMLAGVTSDPATILDADAITRILQGVKPESGGTGISAPAGSAVISFVTGDEDDTIDVEVDGTGRSNVSVWVDAGDGNDVVRVDNTGPVRVTLFAGPGNDRLTLADGLGSISARDVFDGGEGFDTLVLPGGQLAHSDYMTLARSVRGFERIEFTSRVELDAGQLQQFAEIGFAAGTSEADVTSAWSAFDRAGLALSDANAQVPANLARIKELTADREAARHMLDAVIAEREAGSSHVIGVSEGQLLAAAGSLSAWAEGYQVGGGMDGVTANTASAVPAGTLNLFSQGAGSTIAAYGGQLKLTVMAVEEGEAATWLGGDVARADITLAGWSDGEASSVDMPKEVASLVINTSGHALSSLSSVTLGGNGCATIYNNDGSALARIDVSAMERVHPPDAAGIDAAGGLVYLSFNSKAETIALGAGVDQVKLWNSTVDSTDVVVGLDLLAIDGMPDVLDRQGSDRVELGGFEDIEAEYGGFKAVNVGILVFEEILELLAAEGTPAVFHWRGDTYAFAGGDNGLVDDSDVLVRFAGELDLGLLVSSLNMGDGF